jgi:UDP-N-acetylmuramate--alanine ligase
VHLVGVGGVGMSGLARLLLTRGIPTSGSELKDWPALAGLRALGGTIHMRHDPSNLDGVDTVVYSSAIPTDHLELVEARARGLRVLHRSEALAAAMAGRQTLAIAGTHGKTTTTSMLTAILQHAGLDPSFVIGGEIAEVGSNAHHGTGEFFVAEADEHDRSFLNYRPHVAIVTNIDADHLNTYGDLSGLEDAFAEFCRLVGPDGLPWCCAPTTPPPGGWPTGCGPRAAGRDVRRGRRRHPAPDRAALRRPVRALPRLPRRQAAGRDQPAVPGRHLGLNSAAACSPRPGWVCRAEQIVDALAAFPGVRRRFELKGVADGVRVYDEYAYHPTAMTAALETLRTWPGTAGCWWSSSRTGSTAPRDLRTEIAAALAIADEAIVMEVFGPGEAREPGDGGIALTATVALPPDRKVFVASWEDVAGEVCQRARAGDVVVTMGAPADLAHGRRAAGRPSRPAAGPSDHRPRRHRTSVEAGAGPA